MSILKKVRILKKLVRQYGSPLFIVSPNQARKNAVQALRTLAKFDGKSQLFYAMKANYSPPLIAAFKALGIGTEVMSLLELELAAKVGIPTSRIIFSSPIKNDACRRIFEFANPPYVLLDSLEEMLWMKAGSRQFSKSCSVILRFDPDGGSDRKFGLSENELIALYKEYYRDPHLAIRGIHFHLGTRTTRWEDFKDGLSLTLSLFKRLQTFAGSSISIVDVGGGFPEAQEGLKLLSRTVVSLNSWKSRHPHAHFDLFVEPGRMLVADAGTFLCTVNQIKTLKGKKWIFCDIGINLLPGLKSANYRFSVVRTRDDGPVETYYGIAGPLGMGHDMRVVKLRGPRVFAGDTLVVTNAGAYTSSLWEPFATGRPAVIVMSDDFRARLVRRRDSWEELF